MQGTKTALSSLGNSVKKGLTFVAKTPTAIIQSPKLASAGIQKWWAKRKIKEMIGVEADSMGKKLNAKSKYLGKQQNKFNLLETTLQKKYMLKGKSIGANSAYSKEFATLKAKQSAKLQKAKNNLEKYISKKNIGLKSKGSSGLVLLDATGTETTEEKIAKLKNLAKTATNKYNEQKTRERTGAQAELTQKRTAREQAFEELQKTRTLRESMKRNIESLEQSIKSITDPLQYTRTLQTITNGKQTLLENKQLISQKEKELSKANKEFQTARDSFKTLNATYGSQTVAGRTAQLTKANKTIKNFGNQFKSGKSVKNAYVASVSGYRNDLAKIGRPIARAIGSIIPERMRGKSSSKIGDKIDSVNANAIKQNSVLKSSKARDRLQVLEKETLRRLDKTGTTIGNLVTNVNYLKMFDIRKDAQGQIVRENEKAVINLDNKGLLKISPFAHEIIKQKIENLNKLKPGETPTQDELKQMNELQTLQSYIFNYKNLEKIGHKLNAIKETMTPTKDRGIASTYGITYDQVSAVKELLGATNYKTTNKKNGKPSQQISLEIQKKLGEISPQLLTDLAKQGRGALLSKLSFNNAEISAIKNSGARQNAIKALPYAEANVPRPTKPPAAPAAAAAAPAPNAAAKPETKLENADKAAAAAPAPNAAAKPETKLANADKAAAVTPGALVLPVSEPAPEQAPSTAEQAGANATQSRTPNTSAKAAKAEKAATTPVVPAANAAATPAAPVLPVSAPVAPAPVAPVAPAPEQAPSTAEQAGANATQSRTPNTSAPAGQAATAGQILPPRAANPTALFSQTNQIIVPTYEPVKLNSFSAELTSPLNSSTRRKSSNTNRERESSSNPPVGKGSNA